MSLLRGPTKLTETNTILDNIFSKLHLELEVQERTLLEQRIANTHLALINDKEVKGSDIHKR
jgi:hypothetical protein